MPEQFTLSTYSFQVVLTAHVTCRPCHTLVMPLNKTDDTSHFTVTVTWTYRQHVAHIPHGRFRGKSPWFLELTHNQ